MEGIVLTEYIFEKFEEHAFSPALTVSGEKLDVHMTYNDLVVNMRSFACYLHKQFGRQEAIAVCLPNSLSYVVSVLSILHSGNIVVNINPNYTPHEKLQALAKTNCRALVCSQSDELLATVQSSTAIKKVIVVGAVNAIAVRATASDFSTTLADCIAEGNGLFLNNFFIMRGSYNDMALYQLTGGTTGAMKAACITVHNLLSNIKQLEIVFESNALHRRKEVILTALPLYHIFAFTFNLLFFLRCGCNNVLADRPTPSALASLFDRFGVSYFTAVGGLLKSLCQDEHFLKSPPRSIKQVIVGGARLEPAIAELWTSVVGGGLSEGFGLTESSPVVSINPPGGLRKSGSVGLPLPFTQVKIAPIPGFEDEIELKGEICVRGPQVCEKYLHSPEDTDAAFKNGWLHTGDIGYIDGDGYLFITDRLKDLIIVNGFNVYPMEVESAISGIDGVVDVAVVGRAEFDGTEAVYAFVVARQGLTEDVIRQVCRRTLTGYKQPKHIVFVDSLPKSSVGKILKRKLFHLIEGRNCLPHSGNMENTAVALS